MQKFEFLWQPLLGELAMSRKKKKEEEREKNAIYSGHLRLCQQPRAAHALRSDQFLEGGQLEFWNFTGGLFSQKKEILTPWGAFLGFV